MDIIERLTLIKSTAYRLPKLTGSLRGRFMVPSAALGLEKAAVAETVRLRARHPDSSEDCAGAGAATADALCSL